MTSPETRSALLALQEGQLTTQGKFLWGSNYTLLVEVLHADRTLQAVYKPTRGERPLWDFPTASLAGREVAAFLVSEALGWALVPPTVYRQDAPLGGGSLQLFMDHDPEYHYFNFSRQDVQRLRPVALFDVIINNADRKGSHILFDADRHLWLIDHGICFHAEDKLRTVVWDFAGETPPAELCADLVRFREQLEQHSAFVEELGAYLGPGEIHALRKRTERMMAAGRFPSPANRVRPYPWPPI